MPSFVHEAIVELFRHRETLAAEIVERLLGVTLPRFARVSFHETDLGEIVPTERRADLVVVLEDAAGRPLLAIIVEVQLREDPDKPFVWPLYQAGLRARLRCPCCVLVVTKSRAVARWASRPISTGQPGVPFRPLVLGPSRVPRIVTEEAARANTELALLSVLAHGRTAEGPTILEATIQAAKMLEVERSVVYFDLMWRAVGTALRRHLEEEMEIGNYEFANKEFERIYRQLVEAKRIYRQLVEARREAKREGRREALEETARKLLARGRPVEEVAEVTGLSLEDVQHLTH